LLTRTRAQEAVTAMRAAIKAEEAVVEQGGEQERKKKKL
jgi:hypothetical protein